eukprot:5551009-Heterocapsa_arctica.AAC.1
MWLWVDALFDRKPCCTNRGYKQVCDPPSDPKVIRNGGRASGALLCDVCVPQGLTLALTIH